MLSAALHLHGLQAPGPRGGGGGACFRAVTLAVPVACNGSPNGGAQPRGLLRKGMPLPCTLGELSRPPLGGAQRQGLFPLPVASSCWVLRTSTLIQACMPVGRNSAPRMQVLLSEVVYAQGRTSVRRCPACDKIGETSEVGHPWSLGICFDVTLLCPACSPPCLPPCRVRLPFTPSTPTPAPQSPHLAPPL